MNFCPRCAHELTGRVTESTLGVCPNCEGKVVVKVQKEKLTAPIGAQYVMKLQAEIAELKAEINRLREAGDGNHSA